MHPSKRLVLIVSLAAGLLAVGATVYATGPINIIFKTSPDGIKSIEVMRITSNGTVGIGTTTPKSTLDVNGGIAISGTPQTGTWNSRIPLSNSLTVVDTSVATSDPTSITIGTDGFPIISYFDGSHLRVAKCINAACTGSSTITTVDSSSSSVGRFPSITIGTDGLPIISYIDTTNNAAKVAHCGNAACSSGNTISIVGSNATAGTSIAIGTDGLPIISYIDTANQAVRAAKCVNAACTGSSTISYVGTVIVGNSTSITIGTDGLPIISFIDLGVSTGLLKTTHCGNAACSSGDSPNIIDSNVSAAGTSITTGNDKFPIISYVTNANSLKVAKCGDYFCNGGGVTLATVGTAAVSGDTSITIGTDGLPVISYFSPSTNLNLFKCYDALCDISISPTVDSTSNVGTHTSIAIGADGLPVVSYFDQTNGHLKVAKCGSITCIPDWTRR